MPSKILFCNCDHTHQDETFGRRKRYHNATYKDGKLKGWRCTVCLDEKPATQQDQDAQ